MTQLFLSYFIVVLVAFFICRIYGKAGFKWFDGWIGAYFDVDSQTLYICPLPMLVFWFEIGSAEHDE